MATKFNLYRVSGNWYARIIRPEDGMIANGTTGALAVDTTWANSKIALTFGTFLGGYPLTIPTALPAGDYDVIFYNSDPASASNADEPVAAKRITWDGDRFIGLPTGL